MTWILPSPRRLSKEIVDSAVRMVESALARIDEHAVNELDDERRATMVSNLLVVLCGDKDVQRVVNTGSLVAGGASA